MRNTAVRTMAAAVCGLWLVGSAAARPEIKPTAESPMASGWKAVTIVSGLEHPWAMQWLPDGAMLVSERPGRLRLIRDGRLEPTPIAGMSPVLALGQGGLMDVSLHPRFAENGLVYFTYATGERSANRTRLARGRLAGGSMLDVQTIFDASPAKTGGQHFGSRILWLPDGTLLLSIGDGGNPPLMIDGKPSREQAQMISSALGKVHRLGEDGKPPRDNPFDGQGGAAPTVWSYGHRNIQGLALDAATGRVWATEHGAQGGDELNVIERGKNYGWPRATYSREYTGPAISEHRSLPGMEDPKVVWTPCIAPSGLVLYTGDRMPGWKGDLFAGGLVLKQVRRVRLDGDRVVGEETLQFEERIRDERQGPDGFLYVLTDEDNGRLMRIEPR